MAGVGLRETEELKRPLRFVECAPLGVRERVKAGWKESHRGLQVRQVLSRHCYIGE